MMILIAAIAFWLTAWFVNTRLARGPDTTLINLLIPFLFGAALIALWEGICRGFNVPTVLLPPPSMIWERITNSVPILWADFKQTYLKAVIAGYVMGCGAGFLAAIAVDRSDFLRRGLMPVGNIMSALPIVGVAPIMVMWFGFDWQSKAAVVVAHERRYGLGGDFRGGPRGLPQLWADRPSGTQNNLLAPVHETIKITIKTGEYLGSIQQGDHR